MKILFICKYNLFRSRTAEEYFKKINKNKNLKASSAGIIMGGTINPNQYSVGKKYGLTLSNKSKPLEFSVLDGSDRIIVVANDVPRKIFNYPSFKNRVEIWRIPDELQGREKNVERIVKRIIWRVDKLVKKLENTK